ncbi:uncharacterized protein [Maniola hyperantus]|uniref:uncharacterized protein n=1 Tax=Aphantopus hyperantus TaxID=2795564 RepID=UPI003748C60B
MARRLLLVILTEFLILKITSSYMQRYSPSPYAIRDPRSSNPYQPYYARYAPKAAQPAYQKPPEALTQAPRPVKYRQPNYPKTQASLPPQKIEFRPPYPVQIATPTIQSTMEYQSPSYQKTALQSQRPVEYRISPYQKPGGHITPAIQTMEYIQPYQQKAEYLTPPIQPMEFPYQKATELFTPIIQSAIEFQSPTYQKTPELISPTIQIPLDYEPAYQKIVEFIANQKPVETQKSTCRTSDLTSELQPSEIPTLTSPLESLQALALSKSDCLTPKASSRALDTDVLNNLAIALQLLIVNNIINHPRSESIDPNLSDSILELVYPTELTVSNPYNAQSPSEMYNAKFLGSSNFGDDSISKCMLGLGSYGSVLPLSRPGFNLMSPYDAIAVSSPPSESSPSLFTLKNNFQSPYQSIMAADNNNNDWFSMSDLF